MNTIIGLLLKDLYVFKTYRKNFIISMIIFIIIILVASIETNMITPGTILFLLFFGMNSISTFSYDEAQETDKYILSLPINRKEIVKAKYIFAFLNSILALIFGFIISLICTLLLYNKSYNLYEIVCNLLLIFTGISFLICSEVPCIYKWGAEKGRMQAVIIPIILLLLLGIVFIFLIALFPNLYYFVTSKEIYKFIPILTLITSLIIYLISYKISLHFFKYKDL